MKQNETLKRWLKPVLLGAILTGSTSLCLGGPPLTNNFNSNINGWGVGFGNGTVTHNPTGGPDGSGCLMFVLDASSPTNKEVAPQVDFAAAFGSTLNSADYVQIEYDLLIDPASGLDENGSYGNWQEALRNATWGWDGHWVGALGAESTTWRHLSFAVPNNATLYSWLTLALQGTTNYSGSVTGYIDNVVITPFINPLVVGSFPDATEAATWTAGQRSTLSFSTLDAAASPSSGSLQVDVAYDDTNTGWQEGLATRMIGFTPARYTYAAFDIYVENTGNLPGPGLGIAQVFLNSGWTFVGSAPVNTSMIGKWTHVEMPMPSTATSDRFFFQLGGSMTNSLRYYIDNVQLYKPVTAPTIGITKAGTAGVRITMNNDNDQWQRNAIVTPENTGPYLWVQQGAYPVSYSCTITNFPDAVTHSGFEAHMYLVNGDTGGGNALNGATDWNSPDIFIFRVENLAAGGVRAQIQWKTNYPNANATNVPVIVDAASAIGTWTVTFTDQTNGTLSGPGITATNFALPEDVVFNNFNSGSSYIQFGMFKNDGVPDGHNNQAHGTFSRVTFNGAVAPFDDSFSGLTLTNNYVWRRTSASAVTHIPLGTAWFINWSLPADGFVPQSAPSVTGPWGDPGIVNLFQSGASMFGQIPQSALPPGNNGFFRLARPQ
jgi:hypothetical protein